MWTVRWDANPDAFNHTAVTIEGKVYCFGSLNTRNRQEGSGNVINVHTFDPMSHQWDTLQNQSFIEGELDNFAGSSVVTYGHCAYLWGGIHISPVITGRYRFDVRAMTWSRPEVWGDVPLTDANHSACVLGHRMYIFGGFNWNFPYFVRFLDLETFEWHCVSTSGDAPARRDGHTASAIGTRMYIWGGHLDDPRPIGSYDSSLYYLETTTGTWVRPQVEGVAPEGRESHTAFVYDGELYIFGGYNEQVDAYFADLHKYNLETSSWSKVTPNGSGPSGRRCHGCTILGERIFVIGGHGPLLNRVHQGKNIEDSSEEEEVFTDLHVLHLAPTLRSLCMLAVIDAGLDPSDLPEVIRNDINTIMTGPS